MSNPAPKKPLPQMGRLLEVMERLRDPENGCPWDLEQDIKSLRPYVIEEAYEVVEAINSGNSSVLREELGDLLFQVVFQSRVAEEGGDFDFEDVARAVSNKMVSRHPHVFGDRKVSGAREVVRNWEEIKAAEKKNRGALSGVPDALPGLLKALRVGEKAAAMGFDWDDKSGVIEKVHEEWSELEDAIAEKDRDAIEREMGDLLFSLANLARHLGIDAESSLQRATGRFKGRFEHMESGLKEGPVSMKDLSPAELERLWDIAKEAISLETETS